MHRNSELLFQKYGVPQFKENIKVLEIGPNGNPSTFQKLVQFHLKSIQWKTLDISGERKPTHVAKNEYEFGLPDDAYDIVLSGQVIEHVKKVWIWVKELARICKPGGRVITIAPLSWPYHEFPVDCWRFFPEAMRTLYEEAGLKVELCACETLELDTPYTIEELVRNQGKIAGFKRVYPGIGISGNTFLKKMLGWPVSVAFDTVAIGTKRK
jgi:SAM-dependent methyltransferase